MVSEPDRNPFAAPVTAPALEQPDVDGAPLPLSHLDFKTLKRLQNHSHTLRSLAVLKVLWIILNFGLLTMADVVHTLGMAIVLTALPVDALFAYLAFARPVWGRTVMLVICALTIAMYLYLMGQSSQYGMAIIPILINAIGIIALFQGTRLFGSDGITHGELARAWKVRKKARV